MEYSNMSLLLIDDDPFALELNAFIASEAFPAIRITALTDPLSAIQACQSTIFDCILLDYNMPQCDGLVVASQLRDQHPYVPVILCTGAGDEMLAAKAVQDGITDYIPKGAITAASLRRTVLHAIQVTANARLIDEQRNELEGFAFALAHDFKQPLRQITTFANLAIEDIGLGDSDEARKHLLFLSGSARRLSTLVDMMSNYTLLLQRPTPEAVRVSVVIDDLLEVISGYVEERKGSVVRRGDGIVFGNATFLHQALQNLVINGLKYNSAEKPCIAIDITCEGMSCIITVADNGIGIAPEFVEKVFGPLVRLHTNSDFTGTGLGLTLARKAAAAQGGTIMCRSELGVGSEFVVTLPLASAPH